MASVTNSSDRKAGLIDPPQTPPGKGTALGRPATGSPPEEGCLIGGVRPSSGAARLGASETWRGPGVFGALLLPRTAALRTLNTCGEGLDSSSDTIVAGTTRTALTPMSFVSSTVPISPPPSKAMLNFRGKL